MSDKKYYWLKLKRDFFKRHDIRIIESMPNGKDYILFYLKLLCESVDHDGNLRFSEQIPYNEEMLSTITNTNIDIVRSAIKIFASLNMMEILDDGTFYMSEVNRMIGCETEWARKKREWRTSRGQAEDNVLEERTNEGHDEDNVLTIVDNVHQNEDNVQTMSDKSKSKSKRKEIELDIDSILSSVPVIQNDEILKQTFLDYIEMRKKIKKPITERGLKIAINTAFKLAEGDPKMMQKIVEQSILGSYQGIFPLHEARQNASRSSSSDFVNPFTELLKEEGYT